MIGTRRKSSILEASDRSTDILIELAAQLQFIAKQTKATADELRREMLADDGKETPSQP